MSKNDQSPDIEDNFLTDLNDAVTPIATSIEGSENLALFTLGVKFIENENEQNDAVQTYFSAEGYFGIIAEGLFQELHQQMQDGDNSMFVMLREVIRDLEEEYDIDPAEQLSAEAPAVLLH